MSSETHVDEQRRFIAVQNVDLQSRILCPVGLQARWNWLSMSEKALKIALKL